MMKKLFPLLIALVFFPQKALASPNLPLYNGMSQITNVNQLRDVQPTDWAYEALRSLVERYGCIVGFPDGTYRGDRALTRWEFAAGLNACLNVLERLIQEGTAVVQEDMEKLKRLSKEFSQELETLGARVDNLETRTAFLEDHQFSTTTKLEARVIVAAGNTWGGEYKALNPGGSNNQSPFGDQTFLGDRVRLTLKTSFTGQDLLRTRIQAGNIPNLGSATGTNQARLSFDGSGVNNAVFIDELYYRFPLSKFTFWIGAAGLDLDDVFYTVSPHLESSDFGSLSRAERYNLLVYRGTEGVGGGIRYTPEQYKVKDKIRDKLSVTFAYLTRINASNPSEGNGFFNGAFSTGIQLYWEPEENLFLGFNYLYNYQPKATPGDNNTPATVVSLFGNISSSIAEDPLQGASTSSHRFGLQGNWKISSGLNLSLWGGYALAEGQSEDRFGANRKGDQANIWTWNAALSFVDLGKEGAVLTLSGGLPPVAPYVEGSISDPDRAYIIQTQYSYPIIDNIQLTPGFFVIINPNNDSNNNSIWGFLIRSTFKF